MTRRFSFLYEFSHSPANQLTDREHIYPPSSLRNAIEYMALGRLPSGGTLAAGAIPQNLVPVLFDVTGVSFTLPFLPKPLVVIPFAQSTAPKT